VTKDEIEHLATILAPMLVKQLESRVILWIEFGGARPRPEDRERQSAPWPQNKSMDHTKSTTDIESKSTDAMERRAESLLEHLRQRPKPNDSSEHSNARSNTTKSRPYFGPKRKNCGDSPTSTTPRLTAETDNS
jgi:hypothetical protein